MTSRLLSVGSVKHTIVYCTDEPGAGNACHEYEVKRRTVEQGQEPVLAKISFQNGPIKETGVNGIHNEDLICIVIDRLQGFQAGEYACDANALALTHLVKSLDALRARTNEREARGVEGTHLK